MPGSVDLPPSVLDVSPGTGVDKIALRRRIRAERSTRPAHEREQLARQIAEVAAEVLPLRHARCVALYASMRGEPGTAVLRAALRERGVRVLLPVVTASGLGWAADDGRLVTPATGVPGGPHPAGDVLPPESLAMAQVVLVPALAVDTLGNRLGQGGGFYDRALHHAHPAALVAAVVHDPELLDAAVEPVPVEPHDLPVAAALTPSRWHPLADVVQLPD